MFSDGRLIFLQLVDGMDPILYPDAAEQATVVLIANFPPVFEDSFWLDMTPAQAFLARVSVHAARFPDKNSAGPSNANSDVLLERMGLPVVTVIAFCLQKIYNRLFVDETSEDPAADNFLLRQLLLLALDLDYGDEIGRRKTFSLIREMLQHPGFSSDLIPCSMDLLLYLSSSEQDFVRLVVETIQELLVEGDPTLEQTQSDFSQISEPTSVISKRPQTRRNDDELSVDQIQMRRQYEIHCLALCCGMLERVDSVSRDHELQFRS